MADLAPAFGAGEPFELRLGAVAIAARAPLDLLLDLVLAFPGAASFARELVVFVVVLLRLVVFVELQLQLQLVLHSVVFVVVLLLVRFGRQPLAFTLTLTQAKEPNMSRPSDRLVLTGAAAAFAVLALFPRSTIAQESDGSPAQVPRTLTIADGGPSGDFPPPPPEGHGRNFSLALMLGPGWLALRDDIGRDGQMAQSLGVRVGVVFMPDLQITFGYERAWTEKGGDTFSQSVGLLGFQYHFDRFYVGGALGLGWVSLFGPGGLTDGPGLGGSLALGVELLRGAHVALSAEIALTGAQYQLEAWEMGGVRLGLLVF